MSNRQHRVRDGENFVSVTETALGTLYPQALDAGNLDDAERLAEVGTVGPYQRIPHDEIRERKLKEGRLQAVGVGMAAEANVSHGLSLARRLAGYTQAEAAAIIGIAPKSLSRYETGEHTPSICTLVALAHLYGVHVERLLGIIGAEHERLLDAYEFAVPEAREKILEVAEGVQAGRSPEARDYAATATERLREHHISQMEQRLTEGQRYLNELYQQEQDGRGLNRYTDGMIERCQSDELRTTMIRLRDAGANEWTEEQLTEYYDELDRERKALRLLAEQRESHG